MNAKLGMWKYQKQEVVFHKKNVILRDILEKLYSP